MIYSIIKYIGKSKYKDIKGGSILNSFGLEESGFRIKVYHSSLYPKVEA